MAFIMKIILLIMCIYGRQMCCTSFINSIVGVPKVECHEEDLALDIITEKPFAGNIFVKGKAKDSSCRRHFGPVNSSYTSQDQSASYVLPLGRCGMQRLRSANPRGMNFVVTVIISFHPAGFITKYDRAFHVRCFYMEPDEVVSSNIEVSVLPTTVLSDQMDMPKCEYTVRRDGPNGPHFAFANVGDTVFHVWECSGPDMGMMVKKCFVTDGNGEDHAVVDFDGCSTDTSLLSELSYDASLMRAHAQSQVFKYADSNQLYFTCQIRLCQKQMGNCQGVTPPRCTTDRSLNNVDNSTSSFNRRRRRSTNTDELIGIANETRSMMIDENNGKFEIDVASAEMTIVDLERQLGNFDTSLISTGVNGIRPSLSPFLNRMLPPPTEQTSPPQLHVPFQLCMSSVTITVLGLAIVSLLLITASATGVICTNVQQRKATQKNALNMNKFMPFVQCKQWW